MKFRIAKYLDPRTKRDRRVPVEKPEVPDAAVKLAEDIKSLELALLLLGQIDQWNIADSATEQDREKAYKYLRDTIWLLQSWHRYARRKLAQEYLAP
jgi:hypothetical protein